MTTIESKEIRGLTLKILYLLVAFSVTATSAISASYFSLKNDNQILTDKVEILKVQIVEINRRLDRQENKKELTEFISKNLPR